MTRSVIRFLREMGVRRLLIYVVIFSVAIICARYSSIAPLFRLADLSLYDITTSLATPPVKIDKRVTLVVFNTDTLALTQKRSPLDRDLLAKAILQIDALRPKAIGIDILFDQPQPQDDPALISALKNIHTPTHIAYVPPKAPNDAGSDEEEPWQQEHLERFFQTVEGAMVHRASVVANDSGAYVRNWRPTPPNTVQSMPLSMIGGASRFSEYNGPIRFRRPQSMGGDTFQTLPIEIFTHPELVAQVANEIKGRYVLIGAKIPHSDELFTPLSTTAPRNAKTFGIEILGQQVVQALDGYRYVDLPGWSLWALVGAAALVGALICLTPAAVALPISVGMIINFVFFLPILLQKQGFNTQHYPNSGAMIALLFGWGLTSAATRSVTSEQRRFAQSALGKYLPKDVASNILKNPELLNLTGERRSIFVIFTDLEGFTQLSEGAQPEVIAKYLNIYLSTLTKVVLDHGGTLDKFVGDAVIAFWGAPIARPDDGERAGKAAIALMEAGEAFRRSVGPDAPAFGRTRVGLHYGSSLVGNFGGQTRIQYTALGDPINTASRLESANKILGTRLLASGDAVSRGPKGLFRRMGTIRVRGRKAPIEIYDHAPDFPPQAIDRLNVAVQSYCLGDAAPLATIASVAAEFPGDDSLQNLVQRLRLTGPGEPFLVE